MVSLSSIAARCSGVRDENVPPTVATPSAAKPPTSATATRQPCRDFRKELRERRFIGGHRARWQRRASAFATHALSRCDCRSKRHLLWDACVQSRSCDRSSSGVLFDTKLGRPEVRNYLRCARTLANFCPKVNRQNLPGRWQAASGLGNWRAFPAEMRRRRCGSSECAW